MAPIEVNRKGRTSSPAPLKEAPKNIAVTGVKENVIAATTETKPQDWVPHIGQRVRRMDGKAWASKTGWSVAEGEILLVTDIDKDGDLSLENAEGLLGPVVRKKFYQLVETQELVETQTHSRRFGKRSTLLCLGMILFAAIGFYFYRSGLIDYPQLPALVDLAHYLHSKCAFQGTDILDIPKHAWSIPFAAAVVVALGVCLFSKIAGKKLLRRSSGCKSA